jgi:multidrug efflux pump subunit AcrA (membrane-fusion protein)
MFTGEIQRSRSKRPLVITAITILLIAGILVVVPMPYTVKSTYVLAPISSTPVIAMRDGVIGEVSATTGSVVAKGSLIAKYDVSELEKKLPELEAQLATLEKQKPAKPNPKAKAALLKAQNALKAADAALEKAQKAAKGKKTPALAAAEKKQKAAALAVEKATPGLSKEELEKQISDARDAIAAAKAGIAAASILAPASGVLTLIELEKGKTVTKDTKLAQVEDVAKLKAVVKVPSGEAITKGMGVVLVLPAGNKRVIFDDDAKGDVAEAEFDNAKGEFSVGASGDANIEAAERSLVSR